MKSPNYFSITDDIQEGVLHLVRSRLPWLIVGLILGTIVTFMVSRFGGLLATDPNLVFFIPVIVYLADAVGEQTENVYVRNLSTFKDNFLQYLSKEILVGVLLGIILGFLIGLVANFWLGSLQTALTVGFAMFLNVTIAPVIAVVVPEVLFKEHVDPALGGGPFTTGIQQGLSLLIYFLVATAIILS
ncbi:hypothetical protein A2870_02195 [Candidatus Curtissbacteria bacterium RIFCSPHIGHO2_01_FULL_41_11]|uniref:SLC41A/MgtE integral membrane domain-containing protein n=1 Tax=Candidatus Curtissbacteria bacterium RIFCSPHIGHO2_01_FULL_41_11 TaxID=1797711 RepID=A0A1F5G3Y8_9BACT|nr:MAG: hypothetical protein A2870_02195 [Candidatus Curtissbacteria bacterium RIFCSPHIGHO2_01_FULL_41_11]